MSVRSSGSDAPPSKKLRADGIRRELSPLQLSDEPSLRVKTDSSSAIGSSESDDNSRSGRRRKVAVKKLQIADSESEGSDNDQDSTDGAALSKKYRAKPSTSTALQTAKRSRMSFDNAEKIAGVIKKVVLRNFMCHNHLSVDLNSHMNFITGQNGSGKSAILTAIVVALGARVTTMGRGGTMKTLVKEKKQTGCIAITLVNEGSGAYKPERYGKEIIVERKISRQGNHSYTVKDFQGHVVSNKKDELDKILDKFNIHVSNPANILTQDCAKTFLRSLDFHDLYQLYFKATQLEQMSLDYREMRSNYDDTKELLHSNERRLKEQRKEIKDLDEKMKAHAALQQDRGHLKNLGFEMTWAMVRDSEMDVKKLDSDRNKIETRIADLTEKCESANEKKVEVEAKLAEITAQLDKQAEEVDKLSSIMEDKKAGWDRKKAELQNQEAVIAKVQRDIKRAEATKREAQNQIDQAIAKKGNKSKDMEEATKLGKQQQQLQDNFAQLKEQSDEHVALIQHAQTGYQSARSAHNSASDKANRAKQSVSAAEAELNSVKRAGNNQLRRYGGNFEQLVNLIHKNARKFKERPRGPIGCEVELKETKWERAVEKCLGNVLKSFVCDNQQDSRTLQGMMKSAGFTSWRPNIIVTKFHNKKHDVNKERPRCRYETLLDVVEIGDPVVFNAIVDSAGPEGVILIQDKAEMNQFMRDNEVDKLRTSYDVDGNQAFPKPKYRFYSNFSQCQHLLSESAEERIRDCTEEVRIQKENYVMAMDALKEADNHLDSQKCEKAGLEANYNKIRDQMGKTKGMIQNLAAKIEKLQQSQEGGDEQIFEEELERTKVEIEGLKEKKLMEDSKLIQMKEECEERKQEYKTAVEEMKAAAQEGNFERQMSTFSIKMDEIQRDIKTTQSKLDVHKVQKEKLEKLKAEKEAELKERMQMAVNSCPERVETDRDAKLIHKEIERTEQRLKSAEKHVGNIEEVSAEYHTKHKAYKQAKGNVEAIDAVLKEMKKAQDMRLVGYRWLKTRINIQMRSSFSNGMRMRGKDFRGIMYIDDKQKKMVLGVEPRRAAEEENMSYYEKERLEHKKMNIAAAEERGLKNLSGGEKSYTMVVLMLSFWEAMGFPFRCMDEFDVFTDDLSRDLVIEMLINFGREDVGKNMQFIYFTPQDTSKVMKEEGEDLSIFLLEAPREREKRLANGVSSDTA